MLLKQILHKMDYNKHISTTWIWLIRININRQGLCPTTCWVIICFNKSSSLNEKKKKKWKILAPKEYHAYETHAYAEKQVLKQSKVDH